MAVRYDKNFMAEINKVIRRYNAKISRLSKLDKGYILPKKFTAINLRDLKTVSSSRLDIRRELKTLENFITRGGEKNIKVGNNYIPKYLYKNIKSYRRLATHRINKKLKRYETTKPVKNGKTEKFTFAELGDDNYLTLLAKKEKLIEPNLSEMDIKELEMLLHKLRVNVREYDLELWQNNYIDIIRDTALSYGYDTYKLETIVFALQNLSPEEFDELAFENRNIKAVLTHYESLLDIKTASDLEKNSKTVGANLDTIYEHLDEIFSKLKNE